jgi:hypothetical protein
MLSGFIYTETSRRIIKLLCVVLSPKSGDIDVALLMDLYRNVNRCFIDIHSLTTNAMVDSTGFASFR